MKMCSHTTGPQRQNPDIRSTKFIAQRIREPLLARLVGVINRLAREWRCLQCRCRGDVQYRAAVLRDHGVVEHRVGHEHVAVDVGVVHGHYVGDFELRKCTWGSEG